MWIDKPGFSLNYCLAKASLSFFIPLAEADGNEFLSSLAKADGNDKFSASYSNSI
jgi:hypothetical protein